MKVLYRDFLFLWYEIIFFLLLYSHVYLPSLTCVTWMGWIKSFMDGTHWLPQCSNWVLTMPFSLRSHLNLTASERPQLHLVLKCAGFKTRVMGTPPQQSPAFDIPHLNNDPKRHLRFAWLGSRPIFLERFIFIFRYFIKCWANLSNEFFVASFRMFQNSFLFFAFLLLPCAFASSPIRFSIIVAIITDTATEFQTTC